MQKSKVGCELNIINSFVWIFLFVYDLNLLIRLGLEASFRPNLVYANDISDIYKPFHIYLVFFFVVALVIFIQEQMVVILL